MVNDLIPASRIRREDQRFFINNFEIHGIQDIQGNYDNAAAPLKFIGMSNVAFVAPEHSIGNFSISTQVVESDKFLPLTGNSGFAGYIIRDKNNLYNNFGFTSGHLTALRSRCSIGQIPTFDVQITTFGEVGRIKQDENSAITSYFNDIATYNSVFNIQIAGPGSISLNLDDFNTNRLQAYDVSLTIPRTPNYILGQRFPNKVEISYPIEVNASFTIELDSYTPKRLTDFPCAPNIKSMTLGLNHYSSGTRIQTYAFSNLYLVGEDYSMSTDGNATLTMNYRTFLSR